ncbi:MAG: hypothetical protein Q9169_001499 [Polycauliona sp. 2 TL-2023]
MPLVPSSSATSKRKEKGTQFPETAASSWSRLWLAQHPPKASKAQVTVGPPSLVAAEEKYPPLSNIEHISPLHSILPLYPLPSILESPKQKAQLEVKAPLASSPAQDSQTAGMSAIQRPRSASKSGNSDPTNIVNGGIRGNEGIARVSSILPLNSITEAAGVPLPSSPTSQDTPENPSSEDGLHGAQLQGPEPGTSPAEAPGQAGTATGGANDTWTSRLNSILPDAIMDRPSRQSTSISNTRISRATSVAPGAYPESDTTEESLKHNQDESAEQNRPQNDQPQPNEKSVRPRKSVSIVLPDTANGSKTEQEEHKEDMTVSKEASDTIPPSGPQDRIDAEAKATQGSGIDGQEKSDTVPETDEVAVDSKTPPAQAGSDASPQFLQAVKSRTSSIAASHNDTERSDLSTMHEGESLAPSDADNSSLMPLLSSSPGDARLSNFTESLDENHATAVTERSAEGEEREKEAANPPLMVDDSSSISTTESPTGSKLGKPQKKSTRKSLFGSGENREGPSDAASSLPPPKIVINKATSAEESSQSPSLVVPTTTPTQEGPSLPRRQTTFVALGEPLNDERPIKLPIKGRKLYVRKARNAILRQPILNAALGRQVGTTTKQALKKLANGELIVVEPPASL